MRHRNTGYSWIVAVAFVAICTAPGMAAAQSTEQTPPVQLFPKDAKVAFVDFNQVAAASIPGKEIANRLKAFWDGKVAELNDKQKQLAGMQAQLDGSARVLSETARTQLVKNIEKTKRELQFRSDDARAELDEMEQEALADLRRRVLPILKDIASERNLDAIFNLADASVAFVADRVDLSSEVTKRLDAAAKK
jgi:outer membrane protein